MTLKKPKTISQKSDFNKLISYIVAQYNMEPDQLSEGVFEICFTPDVPFARLIFDPKSNKMFISFFVTSIITDCVSFYVDLLKQFPKLILSQSYYLDKQDKFIIGQDAEATFWSEFEADAIANFLSESENPLIDVYYKITNRTPVFATHDKKQALEYFYRMQKGEGSDH